MNNEEFDKSEKATPFKLREAKKKGQVARSMEINHTVILLIFALVGSAFYETIAFSYNKFVTKTWLGGSGINFHSNEIIMWFASVTSELMIIFGPLLLVIMFSGVLANLLQTGPIITTHPLKPDFKKLNPAQGFKKLFSLMKLFDLFKNVFKILLIGLVIYIGYHFLVPKLFNLQNLSSGSVGDFMVSKIVLAGLAVIIALVPITILDFIFSRREFARKMKMSKREVKEEHKRHEGSPEIKSKRKQIQKELLKKASSISNVSEADLIIVNPTHYAVGLKYEQTTMKAPVVVVKGRGEMAKKVRVLAQKYDKPLYRKPFVARSLYASCDIEDPIPLDQFKAVAEIYRTHLAELRG